VHRGDTLKNQYSNLSEANLPNIGEPMRVLLLADDRHENQVVIDHIDAFSLYSENNVKTVNPMHVKCPGGLINNEVDAIIIHYSIFILAEYFLSFEWRSQIINFHGPKIQIIQDEHRRIDEMKRQMYTLGINSVLSSLTLKNIKQVYGGPFMERIKVYSSLPGYFSERLMQLPQNSLESRQYDVVYRGRKNSSYGRLAKEKEDIGMQMLLAADKYGLEVDISSEESDRIYGKNWEDFLSSGRAMLGVEGGSSIFDFDGSIEKKIEEHTKNNPEGANDKGEPAHSSSQEGNIVHKTITPKIFEAIASKTALVLYPGEFRGILVPGRHYIELHKDGSNIKEVVEKLRNQEFLTDLVNRAFIDVAHRHDLTFQYYIRKMDAILQDVLDSKARSDTRVVEDFLREKLGLLNIENHDKEIKINELNEKVMLLEHEIYSAKQVITGALDEIDAILYQNILLLEHKIYSAKQTVAMAKIKRDIFLSGQSLLNCTDEEKVSILMQERDALMTESMLLLESNLNLDELAVKIATEEFETRLAGKKKWLS